MACGCFKHKDSEYSKTKRLAERLAGLEKTDYVIYEQDGKIYCDRKECWTKAGEARTGPGVHIRCMTAATNAR